MRIIGFAIMLLFSLSSLLLGISVGNTADLMLFMSSLGLAVLGLLLWRKRTYGIVTKTATIIFSFVFFMLFMITLPQVSETKTETDRQVGNQVSKESEASLNQTSGALEVSTQETAKQTQHDQGLTGLLFIGNKKSRVFHKVDCPNVVNIKESNKLNVTAMAEIADWGLVPAGDCQPAI